MAEKLVKIVPRKGTEATIDSATALPGEIALTSDTHKWFVGNESNVFVPLPSGIKGVKVNSIELTPDSSSKVNIPACEIGTIPTCGVDISTIESNSKQWIRKIVFNETIPVATSPSHTFDLYFTSEYTTDNYCIKISSSTSRVEVVLYKNGGNTRNLYTNYNDTGWYNSFVNEVGLKWDAASRTFSFEDAIYTFKTGTVNLWGNPASDFANVATVYLGTSSRTDGAITSEQFQMLKNNPGALVDSEGTSNYLGMTQASITNSLSTIRESAALSEAKKVGYKSLNWTFWELTPLDGIIQSYQAAAYTETSALGWYGKMALVANKYDKVVRMIGSYKAINVSGEKEINISFPELTYGSSDSSPMFLFACDNARYYIIRAGSSQVYSGTISSSTGPGSELTLYSTLSITISTSYVYNYKFVKCNTLWYIFKMNSNGGTIVPVVSANDMLTFQETNLPTQTIYEIRYENNQYVACGSLGMYTSADGTTFTQINAETYWYDARFNSSTSTWYAIKSGNLYSGNDLSNMTQLSGMSWTSSGHLTQMYRSSNTHCIGVPNGSYGTLIRATRGFANTYDSGQAISSSTNDYYYHPLDASAINYYVKAIIKYNGYYYLGELKYLGDTTPSSSDKVPVNFVLPNYSTTGTYTLKVVDGVVKWVSG